MKLGQLREWIDQLYGAYDPDNEEDQEELLLLDNSDVRVIETQERGSNWEYSIDYRRSEWFEENETDDPDFAGILYLYIKNRDYVPRKVQEFFGFVDRD